MARVNCMMLLREGLALSTAVSADQAAAWLEGLLSGGAALLMYDDALFNSVDHWITELPPDTFETTLPLIRRTFATFHAPERRKLAERVKRDRSVESGETVPHRRRTGSACSIPF